MDDRKGHRFKFREEYDRKYHTEKVSDDTTKKDTKENPVAPQRESNVQSYMCRYFNTYYNESDKYRCSSPGREGRIFYYRRGDSEEALRFQSQCSKCNANGEPENCKFFAKSIGETEQNDGGSSKKGIGVMIDLVKSPIGAVAKAVIDELLD